MEVSVTVLLHSWMFKQLTLDELNASRLTHHCMRYSASLCARNVFPVPLEPQRITRRCSVNSDM